MKRVVNKDNLKKFIDLINGKPNKPVKGVLNKKPSTGKPNIEKTDWETRFDKTFLNIRFDTTVGTSVNIKDFISQLLKTQREEIISEIEGIVAIYIGSHPIGIEEGPYLSKDKVLEVLEKK